MILTPCVLCLDLGPDRPELAEPAETVLSVVCEHGHTDELRVCPMHAVEAHAYALDGVLHCADCHGHPRHECSLLSITAEAPVPL